MNENLDGTYYDILDTLHFAQNNIYTLHTSDTTEYLCIFKSMCTTCATYMLTRGQAPAVPNTLSLTAGICIQAVPSEEWINLFWMDENSNYCIQLSEIRASSSSNCAPPKMTVFCFHITCAIQISSSSHCQYLFLVILWQTTID